LEQYLAEVYYAKNPINDTIIETGKDVNGNSEQNCNTQNYYNRLKKLNNDLIDINDKIITTQSELTELKAEVAVEEGLLEAANSGIEEISEKFYKVSGYTV
jgi:peptidoglycan hydrolase CwlO-like protein